jgi:hypothetical protein
MSYSKIENLHNRMQINDLCYNSYMSNLGSRQNINATAMHVAAEVPVRVIIKDGSEVMIDYEEIIPIVFDPKTQKASYMRSEYNILSIVVLLQKKAFFTLRVRW